MKLGKANHSGGVKERFKIVDGDNIYRILPPMGNLADLGHYSKYYRVVWGYKGSDGKLRPFVSPFEKNFKTQMVEVDCAAIRRNERLKEELKAATDQASTLAKIGKAVPLELTNKLKQLSEMVGRKGRYNIDAKHHLNAYSRDGKIGLLKIGARAFKALKTVFKSLESQGVDALGVENGRFLNLHRSGTGLDTAYAISEVKEQVNVEGIGLVDKAMPHTLDENIINRLANEAFKLDELYPTPTSEEVARIVEAYERSEAEGMKVVDEVLGAPSEDKPVAQTTTTSQEPVLAQTTAQTTSTAPETSQAAPSVDTTTTPDGTVANSTTGEVVAETVKAESLAPAATETPVETTTAETPTANANAQTNDEFLASLGIKQA